MLALVHVSVAVRVDDSHRRLISNPLREVVIQVAGRGGPGTELLRDERQGHAERGAGGQVTEVRSVVELLGAFTYRDRDGQGDRVVGFRQEGIARGYALLEIR